jgi:glycosyltransferase involved in cell wall biosynthesis
MDLAKSGDGWAAPLRILVLSFYYQPDLCAGSFRTTPFVTALCERAPAGTQVDVLSTLPNRYRTFTREAAELESSPGLEVRRVRLPPHRSDFFGQSRAFARFARVALASVADREYDLVFATSSRLMTAALGAEIARRKRARLYLDIRDIFVDTIRDILPRGTGRPVSRALALLESWTMRRADCINLVSPGFVPYFRARYGDRHYSCFTNGIDPEFLQARPARNATRPAILTVLYAGNIGDGQALHEILPALAHALRGRARFVVIGDGGRRARLEQALVQAGVDSVEIKAPLDRGELLAAYYAADVLFLHLGNLPAFESVLPSKLFEYAALGKPILAGVGGYAARFVTQEISNAAVFMPGDAADAVRAFDRLVVADQPRPEFAARYARANIVAAMADQVLALARRG